MTTNPYFNTYITVEIELLPNQMNNNIYKNLKKNLIEKYQEKCYKHFGLINKIYRIEKIKGGIVIPEDPRAISLYTVKFACKLCKPIKDDLIVFEVVGINKFIINLRNGNIIGITLENSINLDNFSYDYKQNVLIHSKTKKPIVNGVYVKTRILQTHLEHGSNRILAYCQLENIATSKEINNMIESIDKQNDKFTEIT